MKQLKDAYGCVSWQPDLPQKETFESQRKKEWLITEYRISPEVRDHVKVNKYMEDTYTSQRFLLNGKDKPPATVLKDHWPFLVSREGFIKHFERLMGFDVSSCFEEQLSSKGRLLINHAKRKGTNKTKSIAARLEADSKLLKNDLPLTFSSLLLLNHSFKEDQMLLITYKVCGIRVL